MFTITIFTIVNNYTYRSVSTHFRKLVVSAYFSQICAHKVFTANTYLLHGSTLTFKLLVAVSFIHSMCASAGLSIV